MLLTFKNHLDEMLKGKDLFVAIYYNSGFLKEPVYAEKFTLKQFHSRFHPAYHLYFKFIPSEDFVVGYFIGNDGQKDIKKNILGIPTQPFGFSNSILSDYFSMSSKFEKWKNYSGERDIQCPIFKIGI
jgi:uncharacterized protein (DUF2141 family)